MSRPDMTERENRARDSRAVTPPLNPEDCPLEALREMHFLQRKFCLDMEALAETTKARPALARAVLTNLRRDLPLHHADEDTGLFPLLRERARNKDAIETLLDRLSADHDAIAAARQPLLAALSCLANGALPATEDRAALRALAQAKRRHMTVENAIILPLAQFRLTVADRRQLIAAMATRRATPPDAEGPSADLSSDMRPPGSAAQSEGANR